MPALLPISSGELSKLLQRTYNDSVVFQGSEDIRDFEKLLMRKVGVPQGESQEFLIQGSLGMGGVQWSSPGAAGNYPEAFSSKLSRKLAEFKEINATVSVQKSVWDAAMRSPSDRYLEPLVLETQSKALAHKKRLAMALHGDGTGVIGQVLSAVVVAGKLEVQLDESNSARGFVGWFEDEDILILRAASGAASAIDSNLAVEPAFWGVADRQRQLNKVVLQPLDANKAPIAGLVSLSTAPAAGEVFYPFAQPTIPDLTSPIVDYAAASQVMAGLESLCAFDGRVVHGVTMAGATAGTRINASGAIIDSTHIQSLMSQVKNRVGGGRYKYDSVMCAREVYDTFINSGETDRRFMVADDIKRGSRKFVYVHEGDTLEIQTSEYIPKNRIRVLPSVANKKGTLELRMTDFDKVEVDGVSSHLGVNAGGHTKQVNQYMTGYGVLINLHPAACGTIDNFIIA
jgi:hypothetical protein